MGGVESAGQSAGPETFALAGWLFLRLLGVVYFAAFGSLAIQIRGLVGRDGLLPARELLAARRHLGKSRFWRLPTILWINSSDVALLVLTWGGACLAVALVLGFMPIVVLALLWIFYLSLFNVGGLFLSYQWDVLLLETGFLALFIAPGDLLPHFPKATPPLLGVWLLWWLLFRLMFWSGAVKLRSGDSAWRKATALRYHYETQPLPTRAAWALHHWPLQFHKVCAGIVLGIELLVPFLIFMPPSFRGLGAVLLIGLMVLIQLTGNYAFFNLLAIVLCVLLFDDRLLQPVFARLFGGVEPMASAPLNGLPVILPIVATMIFLLSLDSFANLLRFEVRWPKPMARLFELLEPFHLLNSYGLFAVMTTMRPEIILEGSHDGISWQPYEFKWKPDDVLRAPRFIAPHHPRLDWQMWFLALGTHLRPFWFERLCQRLLEGSPHVVGLLKTNPFPAAPPKYVRGVYYDYRFTTRAERNAAGAWWRREPRGVFGGISG
ncbi:MAG TPA: lipase maturation factor family protein [Patescibacteria group bacterium]|nr:lipase maturation factor family protein [Patescibacteria group bacterium]